ncbi:891_t:CDS:2 [Cetraspora pellucida]|uniref:891_t:CDS:1 n=1 Tax=Cetraspora pellucida TaxID=1433469 RepID=A0A9N9EJT1_9GLOM|nr:891_t:CDS:2 [Cetraspora pellucida]
MSPIHEHARANKKFIKQKQNLNKKVSSFLWLSSHQKPISKQQIGSKQLESVVVIDKDPPVPDIIDHNLNGLTNGEKITYLDDKRLAKDFKIGILTLLHRPKHRSKDKISMEEIILVMPSLKQKVKTYRPTFICFNGMAAYEAFMEHEFRSTMNLKDSQMNVKNKWKFGLQPNVIYWDTKSSSSYKNSRNNADLSNQAASGYTKIFVSMSTSGRVMKDQREEQIKYFKELKVLLNIESEIQHGSELPEVTVVSDQRNSNQGIKASNFNSLKNINDVKTSCYSDKVEDEIIKMIQDFQNEFEMDYCVSYFLDDQIIWNDVDNVPWGKQGGIKWYSKQGDNKEQCDQDFIPPKSFKAVKW